MINFPFFTMQQLNLDWILDKLKTILNFMPIDTGNVGDVLQRNADGAAWMPLGGVTMDINGLPYTSVPDDFDEVPIYDIMDQQNKKTTISDIVALASSAVSSVNGQTGAVVLDKTDIGLGNVANVAQYSASNPPPYPVTSVNGQTGAVVITSTAPVTSVNGMTGDVVIPAAPVSSVNSKTGTVVLDKTDIGLGNVANVAQYSASNPPPYPVTSVNGLTGAVSISTGGMNATLLWTNNNPVLSFSNQTIPLNLSDYSFVLIEFSISTYFEVIKTQLASVPTFTPPVGYSSYNEIDGVYLTGSDGKIAHRSYQVSTSSIIFTSASVLDAYNSGNTTNDALCRPLRIWGIA